MILHIGATKDLHCMGDTRCPVCIREKPATPPSNTWCAHHAMHFGQQRHLSMIQQLSSQPSDMPLRLMVALLQWIDWYLPQQPEGTRCACARSALHQSQRSPPQPPSELQYQKRMLIETTVRVISCVAFSVLSSLSGSVHATTHGARPDTISSRLNMLSLYM